jgi:hypothetical protein
LRPWRETHSYLSLNPKIAFEGGVQRILSGKQEWRELGRQAGIEYRRNHKTHEKHEMKEVIGLHFPFSHPSAFREFRVLSCPAVAAHPLRRGSPSQCFVFTILVNTPDLLSGFHCKIWAKHFPAPNNKEPKKRCPSRFEPL